MTENDGDSDLSIAEPDDFFIQRGGDGDELQPVTQPLPGVEEHVRVIPMTMGDVNEYGDSDGQLNPETVDDETVAEILNNHWADVVENEEFEVTESMIEDDMVGFGKEALLTAILRASGYDMREQLNMDNLSMLENVDPGNLEKISALAED